MLHVARRNKVAAATAQGDGETEPAVASAGRNGGARGATTTERLFLQRLVAEEQRQQDLTAAAYVSQMLSVRVPSERLERYKSMVLAAAPTAAGSDEPSDGSAAPTTAQIRESGLTFTGNRNHAKCDPELRQNLRSVTAPSRFGNLGKSDGSLGEFAVRIFNLFV